MKRLQKRSNQVLGILFLVSMVAYLVIFFHLLFRTAPEYPPLAPGAAALLPLHPLLPASAAAVPSGPAALAAGGALAMLVVPGFVWLCLVGWAALGWVLWAIWCMAPVAGCLLAWLIWAVMWLLGRWRKQKR